MLRRAGILVLVFLVSEDLATATTIVIMRTTTGFVVAAGVFFLGIGLVS